MGEVDSEDNVEEETRGEKYVFVANATVDKIEVEIDVTTTVMKANTTGKKFGFGLAPLAGAAHFEVLIAFFPDLIPAYFRLTSGTPVTLATSQRLQNSRPIM